MCIAALLSAVTLHSRAAAAGIMQQHNATMKQQQFYFNALGSPPFCTRWKCCFDVVPTQCSQIDCNLWNENVPTNRTIHTIHSLRLKFNNAFILKTSHTSKSGNATIQYSWVRTLDFLQFLFLQFDILNFPIYKIYMLINIALHIYGGTVGQGISQWAKIKVKF